MPVQMGWRVKVTYETHWKNTPQRLAKAMKYALEQVGKYWHRTFLPKHFTDEGADEYGYEPRSRTYIANKWKRYHLQGKRHYKDGIIRPRPAPLVKTGALRAAVTRAADIKALSTRVTVTMHMPHGKIYPPYARDEIAATSPGEISKLVKWVNRVAWDALHREPREKQVKEIR